MKRIKGFPDYLIAKDGRVFSLKRRKFLKKQLARYGYFGYRIFNERGERKFKAIHRLVMEHYVPNPMKLPEVNHIDGNKRNNLISNLEWCDKSQNQKHAYDLGLNPSGTDNVQSKLNQEQLEEVLRLLSEGILTQEEIGELFGVSGSTICRVNRGKTYVRETNRASLSQLS